VQRDSQSAPDIFVELIFDELLDATQVLDFAYCADGPSASLSAATQDLTEISAPNTALSLDGRR
jgi:hypothetical protein